MHKLARGTVNVDPRIAIAHKWFVYVSPPRRCGNAFTSGTTWVMASFGAPRWVFPSTVPA